MIKKILNFLKKKKIKNDSILRVRCTSEGCEDTYAITIYGTRPPLKGERGRKHLQQQRIYATSMEGLYDKLKAEFSR